MGNLHTRDVEPESGERLSGWALLVEDTETTGHNQPSEDEWQKVEDFQEFEPGSEEVMEKGTKTKRQVMAKEMQR